MTAAKSGFKGYCTHRPFAGHRIPVPVQNLMMRDYAARNGLVFKLSMNEFNFAGSYVQLKTLLKQLPDLEGIIMASIFMLPSDPDERAAIFDWILRHEASLHAVLESLAVRNREDVDKAEELFQLHNALKRCPRTISAALIGENADADFFTKN